MFSENTQNLWPAHTGGRPLCGSELRTYFSPFVDQSTPN